MFSEFVYLLPYRTLSKFCSVLNKCSFLFLAILFYLLDNRRKNHTTIPV
ncbi:hypothetical protein LEQ41_02630 [Streptococcus agalactiae]|nr:hypothetical protein [Streptococcus agalactiae]